MAERESVSRQGIAITMGDPAGVGPELCLRAVHDPAVQAVCRPIIFGDSSVLNRVAERLSLDRPEPGMIRHFETCDASGIVPGRIQKNCGVAAYAYIEGAVRSAMAGEVSAVVTGPIHKEALRLAGIRHPGHTEILAELTGARDICMMMASEKIIVSLVTTHIAISKVPGTLTTAGVLNTIVLTNEFLVRIGRQDPVICVCGLNPHAGEHGIFGDEEDTVIMPAIEVAGKLGINVTGPVPPDTAFVPEKRLGIDAYIVMYHDQGLIPFKMLAFDEGVNITLGLPLIRTSVDHGTAFDIAWTGKASPKSLMQAVLWACRLTGTES